MGSNNNGNNERKGKKAMETRKALAGKMNKVKYRRNAVENTTKKRIM